MPCHRPSASIALQKTTLCRPQYYFFMSACLNNVKQPSSREAASPAPKTDPHAPSSEQNPIHDPETPTADTNSSSSKEWLFGDGPPDGLLTHKVAKLPVPIPAALDEVDAAIRDQQQLALPHELAETLHILVSHLAATDPPDTRPSFRSLQVHTSKHGRPYIFVPSFDSADLTPVLDNIPEGVLYFPESRITGTQWFFLVTNQEDRQRPIPGTAHIQIWVEHGYLHIASL